MKDIDLEDCRLKLRETAEVVRTLSERIYHIVTEELVRKKISVRWVARLLIEDKNRVKFGGRSYCQFHLVRLHYTSISTLKYFLKGCRF
jgi:hypothetical protein